MLWKFHLIPSWLISFLMRSLQFREFMCCFFALAALRILFFLFLIMESLIIICLGVDLVELTLSGDLWPSCTWIIASFFSFGKFSFFFLFLWTLFPFSILKYLLDLDYSDICSFYAAPNFLWDFSLHWVFLSFISSDCSFK